MIHRGLKWCILHHRVNLWKMLYCYVHDLWYRAAPPPPKKKPNNELCKYIWTAGAPRFDHTLWDCPALWIYTVAVRLWLSVAQTHERKNLAMSDPPIKCCLFTWMPWYVWVLCACRAPLLPQNLLKTHQRATPSTGWHFPSLWGRRTVYQSAAENSP